MSGRVSPYTAGTPAPLAAPKASSPSLEGIPQECRFIVFCLVDLLDLFNLQRTSRALALATRDLALCRFHAEAIRCPYTEDPTQTTALARAFGCPYLEPHREAERLSMLSRLFVKELISTVKSAVPKQEIPLEISPSLEKIPLTNQEIRDIIEWLGEGRSALQIHEPSVQAWPPMRPEKPMPSIDIINKVRSYRVPMALKNPPKGLAASSGFTLLYLPRWIGSLTMIERIRFTRQNLYQIPEEVSACTDLTSLDLESNKLVRLPSGISKLTKLARVILQSNLLVELPTQLCHLTRLTHLDLSNNHLSTIDPQLGQCATLTHLNLSSNGLSSVPREIDQLVYLTELDLSHNMLYQVPRTIGNLTRLWQLYLRQNRLSSLPLELGNLSRLTVLRLDGNQFRSLPDCISTCVNLATFDLSQNTLSMIPQWISLLTDLKVLNCENNLLQTVPEEIGGLAKLEELNLRSNSLQKIQAVIGNCTALRKLRFDDYVGKDFPRTFTSLIHLEQVEPHDIYLTLRRIRYAEQRKQEEALKARSPYENHFYQPVQYSPPAPPIQPVQQAPQPPQYVPPAPVIQPLQLATQPQNNVSIPMIATTVAVACLAFYVGVYYF